MTTAATNYPLIGSQAVGNWFQPDTTQRQPLGQVISVSDPYWGGQELIYLAVPASTAIPVGGSVTWDTNLQTVTLPNTANLGVPVAFSLNSVASNAAVQYSWFVVEGQCPAFSGASVAAAAAIGITAAGTLGANSAGKQILNARVVDPATTTVVKANVATQSGSNLLRTSVGGTDGWFVGITVTGTGIPATTTITAIDPDNRTVTMSNNATATGNVSVTGTYTSGSSFWNIVIIDRPFAQGAIT